MKKLIPAIIFITSLTQIVHAKENDAVNVRIFSKYLLATASVHGKFHFDKPVFSASTCVFYAKKFGVYAQCGENKFRRNIVHLVSLNASFTVEAGKVKREYRGSLTVFTEGNHLVLVNVIPVEEYLSGIIKNEMPFKSLEALKAQAIVSRTWIYKNRHRHEQYDFCDLTHCQVYKGKSGAAKMFDDAVKKTTDAILTFPHDKNPADVYYHSACGGKTTAYMNEKEIPSLSYVNDTGYCTSSPHAVWEFFILKKEAGHIFHKPVTDIRIVKRDPSGRVLLISIKSNGSETKMPLQNFYRIFGKSIGWNKLKSALFNITSTESTFIFNGRGFGHGAGFCQWGAYFMSKQGKGCVDILKHYFPKLNIAHVSKN